MRVERAPADSYHEKISAQSWSGDKCVHNVHGGDGILAAWCFCYASGRRGAWRWCPHIGLCQREKHRKVDVHMKIKVVTVGKLKEKYLKQGIAEYVKRLRAYANVDIVEVADEKAPENLSDAEMKAVKEKEGERILGKID